MRNVFQIILMRTLLIMGIVGAIYGAIYIFGINFSDLSAENVRERIESFGIWGPLFYIVIYVLRPLLFLPAAIISALAGAIWGLQGFLYLQIAANLSANCEFFISRYVARDFLEKKMTKKLHHIDQAIKKRGFVTVLLIRLIPNLPWDIQNFALGLSSVKFKDYFFATLIGIVPASFALIYFGDSFISLLIDPSTIWKIFIACLFFTLLYFAQKKLRAKQKHQSN